MKQNDYSIVRLHILFSGIVQGVGFRYTVRSLASRFPVTGYVRNIYDGRVELVAEGKEDSLLDFLRAIKGSFLGRYIHDTKEFWSNSTGEFDGFEIRF